MQILLIYVLFMWILQSNGNKGQPHKKPLHITVLYESLCGDSKQFLLEFLPIYEEYRHCIRLTLVPFGKAKISNNQVTCQHGPNECWGNQIQSCALHSSLTKLQKVDFVTCQMKNFNFTIEREYECTKLFDIEAEIRSCMLSNKVMEYQKRDELKTFRYPFQIIPAIIFNGVYHESLQKPARFHVRRTICKELFKLQHLSVEDYRTL